jgi:hypothetical protein
MHMAWSQSKRGKQKGNQENKQSLKMAAKYGHWVATIYRDSTSEPNLEPGFEPWSCQHWTKPG